MIEKLQELRVGSSRRKHLPQWLDRRFFVVSGIGVAVALVLVLLWVNSAPHTQPMRNTAELEPRLGPQRDSRNPLLNERPTSLAQGPNSDPAIPVREQETRQPVPPSNALPPEDPQTSTADAAEKKPTSSQSAVTVDPPTQLPEAAVVVSPPSEPENPVTITLPREAELSEARSKLASIERGQPRGHAERVSRLHRMYDTAAEHSADRYVLLEALLDELILNQKLPEAWQTRQLILDSFPVTDFAVASAAALRVMQAAASLTQGERAVDWSLRAADQGIREEAFDEVNELLRETSPIAAKASSKELALRVRAVKDACTTAKRMRIELPKDAKPDDTESAKVSQRGRYLCLQLDRWEDGLPWLARCNEARLARAAQADLDGDLERATKEYLDLAKLQKGRAGEALKLRALTLLRKQAESAEGLDAEQLRRRIAMLEADIPADRLIPIGRSLGEPSPRSPPKPNGVGVDDLSGLVGRFRIAGRDVGALIHYPGEVGIGPTELGQILAQVSVNQVLDPDVEFLGIVRVPMATTVVFECRGPKPPEGKTVLEINGRAVMMEPIADYFVAKLDLSAGVHRVRFRASSKQLSLVSLVAKDDRSGSKLPLAHDAQLLTSVRNGFPTRLTVTIRSPN
jgi:hypothetical protein